MGLSARTCLNLAGILTLKKLHITMEAIKQVLEQEELYFEIQF